MSDRRASDIAAIKDRYHLRPPCIAESEHGGQPMRVLTVRQPWAWAIINGGKTVENRVRNIAGKYRGPVAIHVALRDDVNAFALGDPNRALDAAATRDQREHGPDGTGWWRDQGHIIGTVDLIDVHGSLGCLTANRMIGLCSSWAQDDAMHLVLANPRRLVRPLRWRGALGLRELPIDVEAEIYNLTAPLSVSASTEKP